MNRKYLFGIILALLLVQMSGCVSTRGELPYGVWQSEEPYILLDVVLDVYNNLDVNGNPIGMYMGQYKKDDETIDIVFGFNSGYKGMSIFDINDRKEEGLDGDNPYFYGTYKFSDDKLSYKLSPYYAEIYGYKKIVFTKIQDYESEEVE